MQYTPIIRSNKEVTAMKHIHRNHTYSARRSRRYPNEAEPGYFAGRLLDLITAAVTCLGTVTLFLYLATF